MYQNSWISVAEYSTVQQSVRRRILAPKFIFVALALVVRSVVLAHQELQYLTAEGLRPLSPPAFCESLSAQPFCTEN